MENELSIGMQEKAIKALAQRCNDANDSVERHRTAVTTAEAALFHAKTEVAVAAQRKISIEAEIQGLIGPWEHDPDTPQAILDALAPLRNKLRTAQERVTAAEAAQKAHEDRFEDAQARLALAEKEAADLNRQIGLIKNKVVQMSRAS